MNNIIRATQDELLELSMKQSFEIGAVTEEAVLETIREEERIEREFNFEIEKLDKQFKGNNPMKTKLIQKLTEKKDASKNNIKQKIDDKRSMRLSEINEKYKTLRAKEMKSSEDNIKLKMFVDTYSSLMAKFSITPPNTIKKKRFDFPENVNQANAQEPIS